MKAYITLTALFVLCTQTAYADVSEQAYCNYDKNKAEAERLLDQSPNLVVGFGRSNTATGDVLAIGVTESLSKYLQGNLSHKIGDADCQLYRVTTEIQKHVMFDIQNLQLQQDQRRIDLINDGLKELDRLLEDEKAHLGVGTSSLPNVATLEAAREALIVSRTQLEEQAALITIPEIGNEQLASLLQLANLYTFEEQKLTARQSSLQSWDLTLTVGEGSNPNYPMLHSLPNETFGTVQFTWSFGGPARKRALDRAADSYTTAVMTNPTGTVNLAHLLQVQVSRARDTTRASIDSYQAYDSSIRGQIDVVKDVDTSIARSFRVQLAVARINNNIELSANEFTRTLMTKYLATTFTEE